MRFVQLFVLLMMLFKCASDDVAVSELHDLPERHLVSDPLCLFDITESNSSNIHVSKNGKHICFTKTAKRGMRVLYDGKPDPVFDTIHCLTISDDGSIVAYAAGIDSKYTVVINGVAGERYKNVGAIKISNDNKIAASVKIGTKWFVIYNRQQSRGYDEICSKTMVNRGGTNGVIFVARDGKKWCVASIAKEGRKYDLINKEIKSCDYNNDKRDIITHKGKPIVSPNGRRVMYSAKKGDKYVMVVDGVESREFQSIKENRHNVFSSDSTRYAFVALDNEMEVLICDGKEIHRAQAIMFPAFSTLTNECAFVAVNDNEWSVIYSNRVVGTGYDLVTRPSFSNDGNVIGYCARRNNNMALYVGGERITAACDGVIGPIYYGNTNEYSYTILTDGFFSLWNNRKMIANKMRLCVNITAIRRGSFAYIAMYDNDEKQYVCVDGNKGVGYDLVYTYNDPTAGLSYCYNSLSIDEDGILYYYAVSDGVMYRIREKIVTEVK